MEQFKKTVNRTPPEREERGWQNKKLTKQRIQEANASPRTAFVLSGSLNFGSGLVFDHHLLKSFTMHNQVAPIYREHSTSEPYRV